MDKETSGFIRGIAFTLVIECIIIFVYYVANAIGSN